MKSLFDDSTAQRYADDPLAMRVYTSQLLGQNPDLVLHGGGNTSVKIGNTLYVKGSGWNLDTIEKPGFSPVDLNILLAMAERETISDTQMVKEQREAMRDQSFPNPSIEAILHALIPFTFVDHTHADAVVTLTNTPNGKKIIQELYGPDILIVDYVMPGFELAKTIHTMTQDIDWNRLDGIILLNHGVFTFDHNPKRSYEKMIQIVTQAEAYISAHVTLPCGECPGNDATDVRIGELVNIASKLRGCEIHPLVLHSPQAQFLSTFPNLHAITRRGELTPEHAIRIKPFPAIIDQDVQSDMDAFVAEYRNYFETYANETHICLDLSPRYAMVKGVGAVILGKDEKESRIIADIVAHTIQAILTAEQLGGWRSLSLKDIFAIEYWELEQAKLKNAK